MKSSWHLHPKRVGGKVDTRKLPNIMSMHHTNFSTNYRRPVTWNGHPADVMKSGLQKYIRRGMVDKALYCARELDKFKHASDTKGSIAHQSFSPFDGDCSWRRRKHCAITETWRSSREIARKSPDAGAGLTEVVRLLCASEKGRICSHIRAAHFSKTSRSLCFFNPGLASLRPLYPELASMWLPSSSPESLTVLCGELF